MKKIISMIIGTIFLLSLVSAQNEEVKAGITPDSFLWGIDVALEKIRMMFTFGNENKVNYGLKIAEERLAEIQIMAEQNEIQSMNRAETERSEIVDEIEENSEGMPEEVKKRVKEKLQIHITELEEVKENAPEQAQTGLQNAIKRSKIVFGRF